MAKELSEMTLEELWELFPIILKEHNPDYHYWYQEEEENIRKTLNPADIIRINHIGSTSVESLIAKPTVDILLEIRDSCNLIRIKKGLADQGWILMAIEDDPFHYYFNKGYTKEGFAEKVYHLHVRYYGDWNELYFRDYLRNHSDVAREYEKLKLELMEKHKHNRDGYTDAKSEFILQNTKKARKEFREKYKPKKMS